MRRALLISLRLAAATIFLTGLVYPLVVWALSTVLFSNQASGSLVRDSGGRVIGSSLIAQPFTADKYFHPRPSAAGADGYDAMSSGASNLGPTSQTLSSLVESRVAGYRAANGLSAWGVPVDAVTASGSGLDPDISPDNAYRQVARVAKARGVAEDVVRGLVDANTTPRQLGFLGEPRVNVLELNLALDRESTR